MCKPKIMHTAGLRYNDKKHGTNKPTEEEKKTPKKKKGQLSLNECST